MLVQHAIARQFQVSPCSQQALCQLYKQTGYVKDNIHKHLVSTRMRYGFTPLVSERMRYGLTPLVSTRMQHGFTPLVSKWNRPCCSETVSVNTVRPVTFVCC